ncbi:MAG: hypothetical protein Q7R76_01080 [Candidatus Woesearchaeota archaeon]|nr:hypothetical protein [Candidatus Woesearchaeota archaeon]
MMKTEFMQETKRFQEFEDKALSQVMEVSKRLLETFRFRRFYDLSVSEEINKKTLEGIREFRNKNKISLDDRESYQRYLKLVD